MHLDADCSTLLTFSLNKLVFRNCLIDLLWLSSVSHGHILQLSDRAFVAALSSSPSYSTGIWLSICGCPHFLTITFYSYLIGLLWLPSVPHHHILRVSDWGFVAVLSFSRSHYTVIWLGFCGCPQFLTIIFYGYLIEDLWLFSVSHDHILQCSGWAFVAALISSPSYSTGI